MSFKEVSSDLNERLIQSCKKNDTQDLNFCLQQGADVNKTSLCKFFEDDDDDDLEELTPLMIASHHGHHKIVKRLLAIDGIDIHFKDSIGWTALHLCAASGSKECLEEFAKIGLDWNCVDCLGETPLFSAVKCQVSADCVKFILSQPGVNPNIQNDDSDTPILWCLKEMDRNMMEELKCHLDNLDFPMPMVGDFEFKHMEDLMKIVKMFLDCPNLIELDSAIAWAREQAAEPEASSWARRWRTEIVEQMSRALESRAVDGKKRNIGSDNTPEAKRRKDS